MNRQTGKIKEMALWGVQVGGLGGLLCGALFFVTGIHPWGLSGYTLLQFTTLKATMEGTLGGVMLGYMKWGATRETLWQGAMWGTIAIMMGLVLLCTLFFILDVLAGKYLPAALGAAIGTMLDPLYPLLIGAFGGTIIVVSQKCKSLLTKE